MVKVIDNSNFDSEVMASNKTCLIDFYATWCGPCKIMSPIIDEIAQENPDVMVGKVDVDEAGELAMQFGIMSIPTIIVFKNGEIAETFVGVTSKNSIVNAIR
jgi:thioredoxin 1